MERSHFPLNSKDLSVIVTAVKLGDVLAVVDVTTLSRMPFADQLDVLLGKCGVGGHAGRVTLPGLAARVAGVRIDSTGIGAMLAEKAAKRLGGRCD